MRTSGIIHFCHNALGAAPTLSFKNPFCKGFRGWQQELSKRQKCPHLNCSSNYSQTLRKSHAKSQTESMERLRQSPPELSRAGSPAEGWDTLTPSLLHLRAPGWANRQERGRDNPARPGGGCGSSAGYGIAPVPNTGTELPSPGSAVTASPQSTSPPLTPCTH